LERDRDTLLVHYAGLVPEVLKEFSPEERRWAYKVIRLNVFADAEGNLSATWMYTRAGVIQENTRHDEGNAYVRLGDVLSRLGRKDEARDVYEKGVQQAEKHGHSEMAEDLRLALIQLWASRLTELVLRVRSKTGMWGIIKKVKVCSVASKKDALGRRAPFRAASRAAKGFFVEVTRNVRV
jgi:hypothetical protein